MMRSDRRMKVRPAHMVRRSSLICTFLRCSRRRRRFFEAALALLVLNAVFPAPHLEAQNQKPASIHFTNVTAPAGINFVHFKGNDGVSINREEFGPGVCVADFDGDGWQDIYFVNGRDLYNRGILVRNALYHNNGDGTFTDVTDKAGVPGTGYGLGCVGGITTTMGSRIFS